MTHVMIDLETLSTGSHAAILSIGATKFDRDDGIFDTFHVGVTPESNHQFGRVIDAATVMWWLDPARAEAREAYLALDKVGLFEALAGFATWFGDVSGIEGVWGNGASFDNVLLRNAYEATQQECPWAFRRDRCFRTMKAEHPHILAPKREGVHHSALDDAVYQSAWLLTIWRHESKLAVFDPIVEGAAL